MQKEIARRSFFSGAMTALSAARVAGANDRIRLGIMGRESRALPAPDCGS
jgi:hypothetical protein